MWLVDQFGFFRQFAGAHELRILRYQPHGFVKLRVRFLDFLVFLQL